MCDVGYDCCQLHEESILVGMCLYFLALLLGAIQNKALMKPVMFHNV